MRLFQRVLSAVVIIASGATRANSNPSEDVVPGVKIEHLNRACRTAYGYIKAINSRSGEQVGALFASNVDYLGSDGKYKTDISLIRKGYTDLFAARARLNSATSSESRPTARVVGLTAAGANGCYLQFEALSVETGTYFLEAVDYFEVDSAGKITKFRPFISTGVLDSFMLRRAEAQKERSATEPQR